VSFRDLEASPLFLSPLHGELAQHKSAATDQQLSAFQELRLPAVQLTVKAQPQDIGARSDARTNSKSSSPGFGCRTGPGFQFGE
jgi:hypothetical protein